jgi:hypothetical protein
MGIAFEMTCFELLEDEIASSEGQKLIPRSKKEIKIND